MYNFTNQVVIVTGASGNMGTSVTQSFMKSAAHLVLIDRSKDKIQMLFPGLVNSPDHLLAECTDLTDQEIVMSIVNETYQRFGQIDVLVNIAGGFRSGTPVHETPLDTWDFLLNLNARTMLNTCQAVIPHMLQGGSGKIVNIAARQGLAGRANMGAYSASKSAVIRLTESMAEELKQHNINVNCILPGTLDTPQNREAMPSADYHRWVTPEDLANVIVFLVSPAARAIHGASIPVYGLS